MERKYKIEQHSGTPLFLAVTAKNEETKSFLESILKEEKRNIFKEIKDDGTVFVKERLPDGSVKILDITSVFAECTRLVREMRGE